VRLLRLIGLVVIALHGACQTSSSSPSGSQASPAPQPSRSPAAAQIEELVRSYHDVDQFDGVVLVADRGNVVYEGAFGRANREWDVAHTADSRFEIASMVKPMTAMVILQLVDEGKVRLDAPVAEYLPVFKTPEKQTITIEQLLTHRSGLQQDIAFPDGADVPPIVAKINADLFSLDEMVRLIAERPLRFPPGTDYSYSSDGYAVLGAVIEKVTGNGYWQVLDERVIRRAGMTATVPALLPPLVPHRVMGYRQTWGGIENADHIGASPAGGLYSTAKDLFAWERALDGETLLSAKMKQRVFAKRDAITAYGWKTREETRGGKPVLVVRTTGGLPGFVHVLERIPDEDRVIIALCNVRGPIYSLDRLVSGIHALLDGTQAERPRRSVAMAASSLAGRGADTLGRELERLGADSNGHYVDEAELNSLGYYLLGRDKRAAIAVFSFNVARFPRSPNVYDSLGEAQLSAGDRDGAARNYQKVLELDPGNKNAPQMLERIRKL
jgi:CubicO group peptidase (beta-lactamase class C family)